MSGRRLKSAGYTYNLYKEHYTQTGKKYGVFFAFVENCSDPLALGRVQVRVPFLHGIILKGKPETKNEYVPSFALPWAYVAAMGGSGYDSGTKLTPACGTMVAIMFQSGDVDCPVVLGSIHHSPNYELPLFHAPDDGWPNYPVPIGVGAKNTAAPTVPTEAALTYRHTPTRSVLTKSVKGHTIWYDDRDDAECFEVLDRTGQGLRLEGFMGVSDNKGNKARRGTFAVFMNMKSPAKVESSRIILREASNDNNLLLETCGGGSSARLGSGPIGLELQKTEGRAVLGSVISDQVLDIDAQTGITRLRNEKIFLDGEVHFTGKVFFGSNTEFYKLIYSHLRAILNEVNIDDPRELVQTGD
jgi:hypothetical protein